MIKQSTWDPGRLNPGLWLAATLGDVRITGTDSVLDWQSRIGDTQRIPSTNSPNWEPNGWGSNRGAVRFSLAAGGPFFATTTGSVAGFGAGPGIPFSVLMTIHQQLVADHVLCAWDDTGGSSVSNFRVENTGSGRLRYSRTDPGGGTATFTGSEDIGLGHQRVGMSFGNDVATLFCGRDGVSAGAVSAGGSLTLNRFRLGTGPVIDAFTGLIADVVLVGRDITRAEWQAYVDYSIRRWGV